MERLKVTIQDILKRPLFQQARVISGEKGIHREIKWTHILEMKAFDSFINGGELILTTGSNLPLDTEEGIPKLQKLIEMEVAGLCIELGTYVKKIDPAVIEFANTSDFPIIVFTDVVKFVDITQDLHTIIINSHHEQLHHLHELSTAFNELSLQPNGILKILKKLYKSFMLDVILISDEKRLFYYPLKNKERAEAILSQGNEEEITNSYHVLKCDDAYFTVFPIRGLGHAWGNLYIQKRETAMDEFTFSIVDRATLAIAQIMLRNKTIEERKQNQEEVLVQRLLNGGEYESSQALKFLPRPAENLYYRLILLDNNQKQDQILEEDWEEVKLQQAIILRSIFKRNHFFPAVSITKNQIAIIASFYKGSEAASDKNLFIHIIKSLKEQHTRNIFCGEDYSIGVSSLEKDYKKVSRCYEEANAVLKVQKKNLLHTFLFEELGIYRLLIHLPEKELEEYVQQYLGPFLEDKKESTNELLLTLAVYLETMGSKKETSERLAIVRQTLYYRLGKIEQLLGDDFMEPTNRQAIELAIAAYSLLDKK